MLGYGVALSIGMLLQGHGAAVNAVQLDNLEKISINPVDFQAVSATAEVKDLLHCYRICMGTQTDCFAFLYDPEATNQCTIGGVTVVTGVTQNLGTEIDVYIPSIDGNG